MNTTTFRIWGTRGAFALLAGIVGVGALQLRSEIGEVASPIQQAWPAGATARYQLAWQMDSALQSDGSALAGHVDLSASLQLVSRGEVDGATVLEASLTDIGRHRVEVLGREVFPTRAAADTLVGPVAWVRLDAAGGVDRVYFDRDAPPAFKHVMQSVVGLAQITPSADDEWTAVEPGPSGIAAVTYHRDGRELRRTRDRYERLTVVPATAAARPQLAGSAEIELDPVGRIAKLVDDEELVIRDGGGEPLYTGHSHFTLTREQRDVAATPREVPALATLDVRRPGEPVVEGDSERGHLEQRVGKLTFDGLVRGVDRAWGDREAKRQWFSQAVALLQLDPALCAELVEITFADTGNDRARLLAMDLLAAAGHADAQAAMRDALGRPTARTQQVALIQRLSLVAKPVAETARFLLAARPTDRNLAIATAYTSGAVAKKLRAADPALAGQLDERLREALARATKSDDRGELLSALGNTASAGNLPAIREYITATDPDVRGRAAWALRDIDTSEARDLLVGIVADEDPRVARSALAALGRQQLRADDLDKLEAVTASKLADATRAGLVDLLAHHLQDASPAVRRMLEAIARTATDPKLQERARVVLAQLP